MGSGKTKLSEVIQCMSEANECPPALWKLHENESVRVYIGVCRSRNGRNFPCFVFEMPGKPRLTVNARVWSRLCEAINAIEDGVYELLLKISEKITWTSEVMGEVDVSEE